MIRETVRLALSDPRKPFDEHGKLKPIKGLGDNIAPAISSVKVTEKRRRERPDRSGDDEGVPVLGQERGAAVSRGYTGAGKALKPATVNRDR